MGNDISPFWAFSAGGVW